MTGVQTCALPIAAGLAETVAGQVVDARPDLVLSHDNTAAIARIFRTIGLERVAIPDRMAITLDDAARMIAAADKAGVQLLSGGSRSASGVVRRMREVLQSGELGRLRAMTA